MVKIYNNEIEITRGDSALFQINLQTKSGMKVSMAEDDKLLFIVKKNVYEDQYVLIKELREPQIKLNPADTVSLAVGLYYYEVRYIKASGEAQTIIEPTKFEITYNLEGIAND